MNVFKSDELRVDYLTTMHWRLGWLAQIQRVYGRAADRPSRWQLTIYMFTGFVTSIYIACIFPVNLVRVWCCFWKLEPTFMATKWGQAFMYSPSGNTSPTHHNSRLKIINDLPVMLADNSDEDTDLTPQRLLDQKVFNSISRGKTSYLQRVRWG